MKKDLTSIGPDEMTAIENLAYLYDQRVEEVYMAYPKDFTRLKHFQRKQIIGY